MTELETKELLRKAYKEIYNAEEIKRRTESNNYGPNDIIELEKEISERLELLDLFELDECEELEGENDRYKIISNIDQKGGEGEGEEYYYISKVIIKETGEEIFVKFNGLYDSWEGVEWEDYYIVEPKEIKAIEYFNKHSR